MVINLTVGIISHIYIYVERDYKSMLYTLNVKHFIKECYIVVVTSFAVKKKVTFFSPASKPVVTVTSAALPV